MLGLLRCRCLRFHCLLALLDRLQHARIGGHDHEEEAAFETRRLLHHRDVLEVRLDAAEDVLADLAVGDLAAAEHNRDARLVPFHEELADLADLERIVVLLRLGTELDLLELDHRLLLLRLVRALLLLILVLAVVHDLADWRLGHRRDFDEVEAKLSGLGERGFELEDAELFALGTNHAKLACADTAVCTCVADGRLPK